MTYELFPFSPTFFASPCGFSQIEASDRGTMLSQSLLEAAVSTSLRDMGRTPLYFLSSISGSKIGSYA